LSESASDLRVRLEKAQDEIQTAQRRATDARSLQARTEATLAEHLAERRTIKGQVARTEHEIEELERGVAVQDGETSKARQQLESLRETTRQTELERTRVESARDHLDDLCRQELGVTAEQAVHEATESGTELENVDLEELEAAITEIKEKIERIGPVNMTAIEEFAELEERHTFLAAQRQDLDRSMESLKETIRRINRSTRDRFAEAFESIRTHYQEIYRLLFNGGRADLRLEEGEDVLECGIEILAQPPGKRLANINLLSGGEKALSAIALLFAVFRYQPSPFCLLDEVDAALDESNVGRFARMLEEYARDTQFIIVTHNKLTMESADLLYGVTMEEPGVSRLISLQLD
jgi:chromosome segregation protein